MLWDNFDLEFQFMLYLRVLLLAAFLTIATVGSSQKTDSTTFKIRIEAGPQVSIPINPALKTTQSIGFGATARAAYYFTDKISSGVRVNYDYFIGKKYEQNGVKDNYYNLTWTSVMANLQFELGNYFFAGGDAGLGLLSIRGDVNAAFNASFYAGYTIKTKKNNIGIVLCWTQAKKPTSYFESLGLRGQYNFN